MVKKCYGGNDDSWKAVCKVCISEYLTGFLSAVEAAKMEFLTSILRGFIAIILCAVLMAMLFGMTGVWLAFPVAELITLAATTIALHKTDRKIFA